MRTIKSKCFYIKKNNTKTKNEITKKFEFYFPYTESKFLNILKPCNAQ